MKLRVIKPPTFIGLNQNDIEEDILNTSRKLSSFIFSVDDLLIMVIVTMGLNLRKGNKVW